VSSRRLGREREEQRIEARSSFRDLHYSPMAESNLPPACCQLPGLDPMHLRSFAAPGAILLPTGARVAMYPSYQAYSSIGLSMGPGFGRNLGSASCPTATITVDPAVVQGTGQGVAAASPKLVSQTGLSPATQGLRLVRHFDMI
jgi:hypothetical protein